MGAIARMVIRNLRSSKDLSPATANQDSYATGEGLAVAAGSISNFEASDAGHRAAWGSVSRSYDIYRLKPRSMRVADQDDFFDGVKEAENHEG